MKKIIFVLLFLILNYSLILAQTESDFAVTLTQDNNGVIITRYTGNATRLIIPDTIQGMPVREIGGRGAFAENRSIFSVVIPEGVTRITGYAFQYCRNLVSVTLPSSLNEIGGDTFSDTNLLEVIIPPNVVRIGNEAFARCERLVSIVLPEGLTEIGDRAFVRCFSLTSITLPSTITKIGVSAFSDCTTLTTIILPDLLGRIEFGNNSFQGTKLDLRTQAALRNIGYTGNF